MLPVLCILKSQKLIKPGFLGVNRWYCSVSKDCEHCFRTLGIPDDSDQETVRQAFLNLVKKYHPDSKTDDADPVKFQQIETAYRTLQEYFARLRFKKDDCEGEYGLYYKEEEKIEEYDIQHTAPQHRQYLDFGGHGTGTPAQRQRQYEKFRAGKAIENVTEYTIKKINDKYATSLVSKEKKKVKDIRTGLGMERLVEDLIQESISKGEFNNLSGTGKPLKQSTYNPYVDFVTHKMNEVLIDNGFTPQWITLQKEIRDEIKDMKDSLIKTRKKLGPLPINNQEELYWKQILNNLNDRIQVINSKIDTYNLVVPILNKQMFHIDLITEANKILVESPHCERIKKIIKPREEEKQTFLKIFNNFFKV